MLTCQMLNQVKCPQLAHGTLAKMRRFGVYTELMLGFSFLVSYLGGHLTCGSGAAQLDISLPLHFAYFIYLSFPIFNWNYILFVFYVAFCHQFL